MAKLFSFSLEGMSMSDEDMDPTEITNSTAEVEEMHDDMAESVTEVEDMEAAIEEGGDAMGTLEEVKGVMVEGVETGEGVPESTAKAAEIILESFRKDLGITKSFSRMPAIESFKQPRTRLAATKVAVESFNDTIKKVFARIIEICKMIWTKIKTIIGNMLKNYGTLEKHLEMLKTKASAMTGNAEKTELEKPGLAKFFMVKNSNDGFKSADSALETVGKFGDFTSDVLNSMGDITVGLNEDFNKVTLKLIAALDSSKLPINEIGKNYLIGPFPGGCRLKITVDKETTKYSVESEEVKFDGAKTISVLTKDEIIKLLSKAISETKNGDDIEKNGKKAEDVVEAIRKASENILKILSKEVKEDEANKIKMASNMASSATKLVSKLTSKLPSVHFSTLKMVGDYAAASMGVMKKGLAAKA